MYKLLRPLLFKLSPETAHHLALRAARVSNRLGLLKVFAPATSTKAIRIMGIDFPNKVGLAAGLDKNGEYIDALGNLGFGFIEIGTVTPRPQPGNPSPRLFRIPEAEAIINRMGFNNEGVDYLIKQVEKSNYSGVLGINIGKNFDTPVEKALDDYVIGLQKVYCHADYVTINISSPNTPGLRTLQYGEELEQLLKALKKEQSLLKTEHNKYTPIVVKVAPDLSSDEIEGIAKVLLEQKIDGLIATNTTLSREKVESFSRGDEQGGLSGKPLTDLSTQVIAQFFYHLKGEIPIIGVGGISSPQDAKDKLNAGADLIQLYSGLVYEGISLVKSTVEATA
ncbi:MAG: quinone-dependent dihydroorotate dehydrogenase [Thiotrichaceae bacterium]